VHDLPEQATVAPAEAGELLDLLVGDPNAGAEAVLLGSLEAHPGRS
jgi:hypothetical protein